LKTITPEELGDATKRDETLKLIANYITDGFPKRKTSDQELRPFIDVQTELSIGPHDAIYRGSRAVIPQSLREQVLKLAHEGHFGIKRTKALCREAVWWPRMDTDIEHFIQNCDACAITDKGTRQYPQPPVNPIPAPKGPWRKLALDILGPFTDAPQNCRFLLVLIDMYSKWPIVCPVHYINTTAVTEFLSDCFTDFGLPGEIDTDNGKQFVSKDFEDFLSGLQIKHCRTALYNPRSNGAVERFNRVIVNGLRAALSEGRKFTTALRSILAGYRSTPQAATEKSPAELHIGRRLRMPLDTLRLTASRRTVHFPDDHYIQRTKQYADNRLRARHSGIQIGDRVRVRRQIRHSKLEPIWSQPFTVVALPGPDTARLENGSVWSTAQLKPATGGASQGAERLKQEDEAPRRPQRSRRAPHHFTDFYRY
jgi:transposase InsO family protein